jgi:hypothetical protein
MKLNELRLMVRNELELFLEEFAAKEMPNGSAWKTKNKGWAAKNNNGVVNYWYGPDEAKNKAAANAYKNDSSKKATNELKTSTLGSYVKKAAGSAIHHGYNTGAQDAQTTTNYSERDKHARKSDKRERGIATATDTITKRASESVTNELNQSTLQSYKAKSQNSMREPVKKALSGQATDTDYSKFRKRASGIRTASDKLKTGSYSDRKKTEK